MERTRKSWGEKWNIFQNDLCEVSVLYLEKRQRCSWHKHQAKFNLFFVIEGELYIKLEDGESRIKKGQIFTIRPGEYHEFQTHILPATIIEVMYVCYDSEDIQRENIGGPLKEDAGTVLFDEVYQESLRKPSEATLIDNPSKSSCFKNIIE